MQLYSHTRTGKASNWIGIGTSLLFQLTSVFQLRAHESTIPLIQFSFTEYILSAIIVEAEIRILCFFLIIAKCPIKYWNDGEQNN